MSKQVGFVLFLYLCVMQLSCVCAENKASQHQIPAGQLLPLMMHHDQLDFKAVKQQIKDCKPQEVTFYVLVDGTSGATMQRKGLLVRRQNARGTVIICHGYLGCKRDAIALKHLFPFYNVLAFDFRAHGELIEGQKSTIGRDEAYDVMGAAQFIKADPEMSKKPLIVYGYSMGAVASIEAQSKDGSLFDAMILDCPYDSTDNAMRRGLDEKMKLTILGSELDIPGKEFILAHMYDESAQIITNYLFKQITALDSNAVATRFTRVSPIESVKKITVPCLFIHCDHDKKVPTSAVKAVYDNKPGFKELWITFGKGHFGSYNNEPEMYWYRVNKFLNRIAVGMIAQRQQEKIYDQRLTKNIGTDHGQAILKRFVDNKKGD